MRLDNILLRKRTCAACSYAESVASITAAWARECAAWEKLETLQAQEWARIDACRIAHETREREARIARETREREARIARETREREAHNLRELLRTTQPSPPKRAALVIEHLGAAMKLVITQYAMPLTLGGWGHDALPDGAPFARIAAAPR